MKSVLNEIGLKYDSDKSSNYHNYLTLYERYLADIREKECIIVEIGILNGDSLKILSEYFPNSTIIGIDILDKSYLTIKNCKIIQGDQSDRNFLNSIVDGVDIIIDDGSHKMSHQQISLGFLFKKLKNGGIYIIEDLHTSLPEYFENINFKQSLFELNEYCNNSTFQFLKNLKNEKLLVNNYLDMSEIEYLKENVKTVDIFRTAERSENSMSITSVIIKK
jgi:hypothetical protein